jgi:Flp pilus assembly protein TadB
MNTFQDEQGNSSSMRIMAFICVLVACVIGLLAVILNRDLSGAGVLVGAILLPAMGSKALQRFAEEKKDARDE